MKKIKISIITPTFNSEKTISRTIESVQKQNYDNYEHIIIDGLSNDSTVSIVKKYMSKDNHIKLVSEKDNGIYDAMNKGIRLSDGEIVAIINSDDYYEDNAFDNILKNYDSNEKYQVIYGMLRKIYNGEEYQIYCNNYKFLKYNMITHPTCFITKKTYDDFGCYDLNYRLAADYDLMIKYSLNKKIKFKQVNKIIANYSLGGASGTQKSDLESISIRKKYGYLSSFGAFARRVKVYLIMMIGKNKKY